MSKFFFYIFLISSLILQIATPAKPLFHICSPNTQNLTDNGNYHKTLNHLMYTFQSLAPAKGFALGSLGQNNQDRPVRLTLCRGDISGSNCTACIAEARTEIQKLCPNNKAGSIWYDTCLVKYSDVDFFGQNDGQTKFCMASVNNVSDDSFMDKTKELLSGLAVRASSSSRMYAGVEIGLHDSNRIYGLAQCSRDLLSGDCVKCLNGAIAEINGCSYGKEGERVVVGASCTVRYEVYPFVNAYQ